MNAAQVNLNPLPAQEAGALPPAQALSALVDGELAPAQVQGLLTAAAPGDTEVLAQWHSYLVIGDVLRGTGNVTPAQPAGDFLAGVRERLRAEALPQSGDPVAIPARAPGLLAAGSPQTAHVRAPAANDSLFRWKLVAGFASLAAVSAVSWGVLSGAPSGVADANPQLAAVPPAVSAPVPETTTAAVPAPSIAVVVNTGQGTLIRDARLEELLAEHRQNAGISALQMPTGFLRNATYDAAGR